MRDSHSHRTVSSTRPRAHAFTRIMTVIAYLGPENTNTHLAAQAKFGRRGTYLHAPTIDDVFHLVERRNADCGVVPVENSLEGAVAHTLDRFADFIDTPVRIQGEIQRPIRHCLIVRRSVNPLNVRVAYSHPQALAQCRLWLEKHLPHAVQWETRSTAEAVQFLINKRIGVGSLDERGVIGSPELAREHGLETMAIPETRENKTRFLILGLGEPRKGRRNKTSILFALKDRPGALHGALVPFKRHKINLTKIESRPSKRKAWEYLFFIDVEGHESEPRVRKALKGLERSTSLIRILGSYPVSAA